MGTPNVVKQINSLCVEFKPGTVLSFKRILLNGVIITSELYGRVKRRNSSAVALTSSNYRAEHALVREFLKVTDRDKSRTVYFAVVRFLLDGPRTEALLPEMKAVRTDKKLTVIPLSAIREQVFLLKSGSGYFVCKFPNNTERE